jgi:peptide/nickel transport system substrate-binding protein
LFHDGSPVTAPIVRDIIAKQLPGTMGASFEDVRQIAAVGETKIEISLSRPSSLLLESFEFLIQKQPEEIGTGLFYPASRSGDTVEMRANERYHGGRAILDTITLQPYPSVRAAWAELLRGRVDMLYDVGAEALASLSSSTNVIVYSFSRPYQYVVVLNTQTPKLRSPTIRRALNAAIDRAAVVRDAMEGQGEVYSGPVHAQHWAFKRELPVFGYAPKDAAEEVRKAGLTLTFLVPPGASYERVALHLKRQLEAVGVQLLLKEVRNSEIADAFERREFEGVLVDLLSGPGLARPY